MKTNKGITIFEVMMVIAIMAIIISVVVLNLSDFKASRSLENTANEIVSIINKARNNTISSLNSNNFGIHFENDKIVLFTGTIYNSSNASNEVFNFESSIEIDEDTGIVLNGGGVDVVFEKITGETDDYGTIVFRLKNDHNTIKTININKLGVISLD